MTSTASPANIRPARPQDRDAIVEVARATGLFPPDDLAQVHAMLDAYLAGTTEGDRLLVIDGDDGLTALAYYAPERMTDGTWNLYLLAVHPTHQGKGLGGALVRQVEEDLRSAGVRVLLIETSGSPDFAGQRAFYSELGYYEEARIREFYAPTEDKFVYWKHL